MDNALKDTIKTVVKEILKEINKKRELEFYPYIRISFNKHTPLSKVKWEVDGYEIISDAYSGIFIPLSYLGIFLSAIPIKNVSEIEDMIYNAVREKVKVVTLKDVKVSHWNSKTNSTEEKVIYKKNNSVTFAIDEIQSYFNDEVSGEISTQLEEENEEITYSKGFFDIELVLN